MKVTRYVRSLNKIDKNAKKKRDKRSISQRRCYNNRKTSKMSVRARESNNPFRSISNRSYIKQRIAIKRYTITEEGNTIKIPLTIKGISDYICPLRKVPYLYKLRHASFKRYKRGIKNEI